MKTIIIFLKRKNIGLVNDSLSTLNGPFMQRDQESERNGTGFHKQEQGTKLLTLESSSSGPFFFISKIHFCFIINWFSE